MIRKYAMLVASALISGGALANGNDLLRDCVALEAVADGAPVSNAIGAARCAGVMTGTTDLMRQFAAANQSSPISICPPDGVNPGQFARIALAYMRAHPAQLTAPEGTLVWLAMREAFPCSSK